jgi:hypothetical protein
VDAVYYPRLVKRVRAVLIDSVLVPVVAITSLGVGYGLGVTDFLWRALLVGVPVFILEPGLVTITGGTVGHHLVGIRVQRKDGSGNLNIIAWLAATGAIVVFGWSGRLPGAKRRLVPTA